MDYTVIPEDYIVHHRKTDTVKATDKDGNVVCEIELEKVPLVRCMDCRYGEYGSGIGGHRWCKKWSRSVDVNGFCSDGKKGVKGHDF